MDKKILIKETLDYLKVKKIYNLNEKESPALGSCWSVICEKVFGKFIYKKSDLIKRWWINDRQNFKSEVLRNLESSNEDPGSNLIFYLTNKRLESFTCCEKRKRLSESFGILFCIIFFNISNFNQ